MNYQSLWGKILFSGLLLTSSMQIAWANAPSAQNIVQWITNIDASNADPKRSIQIDSTQEITLYSGEKAYVSSVSFDNSGRNFWAGYILTRPSLRQSQILEFGGQSNTFRIHPVHINQKSFDLIEFESASSGQGATEGAKSLTYIQNWKVTTLRELQEGSYEGRYSDTLEDIDCKTGSDDSAYFNVMEYHGYILETTVEANGCEHKSPKDYKVTTKLTEIKIP